jgi:hypothetical protein
MCDCLRKRIVLSGYQRVQDRYGRIHRISCIDMRRESYVPDVYVRFDRDVLCLQLYDDARVIRAVMTALTALSYAGPPFERAELGLQGRDHIVLEGGKVFGAFAESHLDWRNLVKSPSAV